MLFKILYKSYFNDEVLFCLLEKINVSGLCIAILLILITNPHVVFADESSNSDWCQVGHFNTGDMFRHWGIDIEKFEEDLCITRVTFNGEGAFGYYYCHVPLTKIKTVEELTSLIYDKFGKEYCFTIFEGLPDYDKVLYSPKKQVSLGISPEDVLCDDNFKLIFKTTNGSPVCVKPTSYDRLLEIGWGTTNRT